MQHLEERCIILVGNRILGPVGRALSEFKVFVSRFICTNKGLYGSVDCTNLSLLCDSGEFCTMWMTRMESNNCMWIDITASQWFVSVHIVFISLSLILINLVSIRIIDLQMTLPLSGMAFIGKYPPEVNSRKIWLLPWPFRCKCMFFVAIEEWILPRYLANVFEQGQSLNLEWYIILEIDVTFSLP